MITVADIQAILDDFEIDQALAFLKAHGNKDYSRLERSRKANLIRHEVEVLLQNPELYAHETTVVKVIEKTLILKEAKKIEEPEEVETYPDHYPAILVEKLKEARRLVSKKRYLSNSLYLEPEKNKKEECEQILGLSEQIDFIYEVKKQFDLRGILPSEWVQQRTEDASVIQNKIKNLNTQISKLKAKLKNPSEKSAQWSMQLREAELERASLKAQLGL